MQPPTPPAPHFASPYARPSMPPSVARRVTRPDGARIAFFVYGSGAQQGAAVTSGTVAGSSIVTTPDATSTSDEIHGPSTASAQATIPVLFLHGNGEEHGIFGPQIDAVVERGGIAVGVDSRAQGFSTRGTARLTYELMAEDALAVLDELNIPRAHVVGFSDGAIEALLLARDHADRVASAVAVGANLTPEGVDNTDFPMEEIAEQNEAWVRWLRSLEVVSTQDKEGRNAETDPPSLDPALLMPSAEEARNTADLMRLMMEEPHIPAESLGRISCPVAVVAGEFDVIFPRETLAIKRAIPHAELFIAPDCGHSIPKHAPEFLTKVMLRTMRRFSN